MVITMDSGTIERREMNRRELDEIHKSIKYLQACAVKSSDFRGQARVVGVVASLIFISSFLYTFNHKMDAHADFDRVERAHASLVVKVDNIQRDLEVRLDRLEANSEVAADRYDRLIRDITTLNLRVTKLINILIEKNDNHTDRSINSLKSDIGNDPYLPTK